MTAQMLRPSRVPEAGTGSRPWSRRSSALWPGSGSWQMGSSSWRAEAGRATGWAGLLSHSQGRRATWWAARRAADWGPSLHFLLSQMDVSSPNPSPVLAPPSYTGCQTCSLATGHKTLHPELTARLWRARTWCWTWTWISCLSESALYSVGSFLKLYVWEGMCALGG